MPVDPVLPHGLDDLYGPGAEDAEMADVWEDELKELEDNATDEIEAAIETLTADPTALREIQPPTNVVRLAAEAAAKVLIAFERGYRMEREPRSENPDKSNHTICSRSVDVTDMKNGKFVYETDRGEFGYVTADGLNDAIYKIAEGFTTP